MWRSEVGMIRCMLLAFAFATASMSLFTPLEALQISACNPCLAIKLTASNSPSETAAKPASMTSTPNSSSRWAIRSLFSGVNDTPGVCSPSRRVVSKIFIRLGKRLDKAIPHFPSLITVAFRAFGTNIKLVAEFETQLVPVQEKHIWKHNDSNN
jgi:hypothetical protein